MKTDFEPRSVVQYPDFTKLGFAIVSAIILVKKCVFFLIHHPLDKSSYHFCKSMRDLEKLTQDMSFPHGKMPNTLSAIIPNCYYQLYSIFAVITTILGRYLQL